MIPSVTTTEKATMASRRSRTKISPRSFQTVRRMTLMGTEGIAANGLGLV
jgi:hypothetical protein